MVVVVVVIVVEDIVIILKGIGREMEAGKVEVVVGMKRKRVRKLVVVKARRKKRGGRL